MLRCRVSELLPDIRDMQSGAKCCFDSISEIDFGPDRNQMNVLKPCRRIGPPISLVLRPWEPPLYSDECIY